MRSTSNNHCRRITPTERGFTIVELLIVIVIIAILAAITIVAFNGVQVRARDSQRRSDVAIITKALELYYIDNGKFPNGNGSTTINAAWSTTADSSWANLATALKPYAASLPSDPLSTSGSSVLTTGTPGTNYAYFADYVGSYCGNSASQTYILVYRLEGSTQANQTIGNCSTAPIGYYAGGVNYRVSK
jgi:type II secretion system protein G